MKILSEMRKVKELNEADILSRPGLNGVDIGYKYVGGKKTDELAIRVFVEKKKDVPLNEKIPETIQGIKTDVIARNFKLNPLFAKVADIEIKADTNTYEKLKGGISIGPCRDIQNLVYVGTLGAIVKDNITGNSMLLSNFHVMCVDDKWSIGDEMVQPSRVDNGHCPYGIVGTLERASLGEKVDCAVANHAVRSYENEIIDVGDVTGTTVASIDMAVRKRGRTTGLTYGTVYTVDLSVKIHYGNGLGEKILYNQIGIEVDSSQSSEFGIGGDSGSVVVNDERKVVGLYFAGSMEERDEAGNIIEPEGVYGIANPIQDVIEALDISFFTSEEIWNIVGTVKDKLKGTPIGNAKVSTDTGQSTFTDLDGTYKLGNVPIGKRLVTAFTEECPCACTIVPVEEGKVATANTLELKCPQFNCIVADCNEGLGRFDQESGDYPVIDNIELHNGKPTCKAIDVYSIQAHAGYYAIGTGGNEFEFDIDQYPILRFTMKAEKDTDTCLLIMVHDKEPHNHKRRFVTVAKTPKGNQGYYNISNDFITIQDDGQWHDYTYDLRRLREDYQNAETIRIVQFYSYKNYGGTSHAFHISSLVMGSS